MMKPTQKIKIAALLGVLLLAAAAFTAIQAQARKQKTSHFGVYQGYTEAVYTGSERRSEYLVLEDGTRLAYDLILPTKDGVPAAGPLPVLFKYTPYLRSFRIYDEAGNNIIANLFDFGWQEKAMLRIRYWIYERGHLMDPLFRTKWLESMLYHGYAVVVVERPGTGASFGVLDPSFEVGAAEANEILNWIATQDWCDGNIGMYGDSWQAQIQFAAASTGNPYLKAIFPTSSAIDNYSAVIYPGGVFNKTFGSFFAWSNAFFESEVLTPVDSDPDGKLLEQAREARQGATVGEKSAEVFQKYPFRDGTNNNGMRVWEDVFSLYSFIDRVNQSGIPVYMTNGWYDLFTRDMFLWYANLTTPKRLIVRPLDHSEIETDQFDLDYGVEAHRWFDYWLKGIDNGIMEEPPIYYYVMNTPQQSAWQTADAWPPVSPLPVDLYLGEGKTSSVASSNDGNLTTDKPLSPASSDSYTVDYTTSSGEFSRWNAINRPRVYPDMVSNDEKALTYTTPPLEKPLTLVGHPIIHLWLTTDAPDLDVFAYLETVNPQGRSTYLTEGVLRASHRTTSEPLFDNLGLPYRAYYQTGLKSIMADVPVELVFDLLPIAYQFKTGDRIRITVAFADNDNFDSPIIQPAPEIRLLRNSTYPSHITLPVVPPFSAASGLQP